MKQIVYFRLQVESTLLANIPINNGGLVLPVPFLKELIALVSKRNDKKSCLASNEINKVIEANLTRYS